MTRPSIKFNQSHSTDEGGKCLRLPMIDDSLICSQPAAGCKMLILAL